jgi:hypothetical protein
MRLKMYANEKSQSLNEKGKNISYFSGLYED